MKESKLLLKENPEMKDFQKYIRDMIKERGFERETLPELFFIIFRRVW